MSTEENTKYCTPICRDFSSWNLPVVDPWRPSNHGIVESRHQIFADVKDFRFNDGAGGPWPTVEYVHKRPGGVSTTGAALLGYWPISDKPGL